MQQPFDLSGKVALVTGAYRGLGFAIAQGLARAGAKVVLNGRRQDALDSAAESLRNEGLEVSTSAFDVTDRTAIDAGVGFRGREPGPEALGKISPRSRACLR